MSELRECPFCGTHTAKVYQADAPYLDWFVKCTKCNNSMPPTHAMVYSKAEATAAWNRRDEWEDVPHNMNSYASNDARWSVTDAGEVAIVYPDMGVHAPLPDGWHLHRRKEIIHE